MDDIDLFDINEAFAPQWLAVAAEVWICHFRFSLQLRFDFFS